MDNDILSTIPGELLGDAVDTLPAGQSSSETTQTMILRLPERSARVDYVREVHEQERPLDPMVLERGERDDFGE